MGRYNPRKRWEERQVFAMILNSGIRPTSKTAAFAVVPNKLIGMYKSEAHAVWDTLRPLGIKSFVEVGRNMGGGLFFLACACNKLERVLSIDIRKYELTDAVFPLWFKQNDIELELVEHDSTTYEGHGEWDFVWIDGGHTGEIVAADIACWKDRCKYIGFHDFADRGRHNKHVRVFKDVVAEIKRCWEAYGWEPIGRRGRSDIIFATGK